MIKTANLTHSVSRNAGGLFESVRRLMQSLQQTGMEVCIFGIEDENSAADIGAWMPVPARAFRPYWPSQFGYTPEFAPALEEFKPDLTHTHGLWMYPSIATSHYCRRRDIPYIISPHGMLDPWAVRNSRWKKVMAYWLYERTHLQGAACLRALCESEARAMRQFGMKNPIAIIPNGIDLPLLDDGKELMVDGSLKSLKNEGKKVLLYLGRIHPKKGLVNLLKAWAANRKSEIGNRKFDEWLLAITGWDQGGHEAELKMLCAELKVESSVRFLGPQFGNDKASCFRHCDAFVLPSFSEGLPMVVLEAWAYGKPVLMTPECNLPEGFSVNAALRIEPDQENIKLGLHGFFQMSGNDRQAMGARGLKLVSERFTWPRVASEMRSVYDWMLGGGTKPGCVVD